MERKGNGIFVKVCEGVEIWGGVEVWRYLEVFGGMWRYGDGVDQGFDCSGELASVVFVFGLFKLCLCHLHLISKRTNTWQTNTDIRLNVDKTDAVGTYAV